MARFPAPRWLAVAAWITVIFTAIPFARALREVFVARWPAGFLGVAVMAVAAASAGAAIWILWRRRKRIHCADIAWLAGTAAAFIVWTLRLMGQPEEAVHLVEYGVLGVLLYRALRPSMDNPGVFVAAALLGTLVGTIDEVIQWIVPGRYWDFRDLALNGGASALVQIGVWRLASRPFARMTPSTLRVVCRLAAVEVLLLTIVTAATPQRLHALARSLPVLAPLAESDDVICEYGFLHRLDPTTAFRSRLSWHDLSARDGENSIAAAATLDRFKRRYGDFLRSVSPIDDPFAYEARVHIFARNRARAEAGRHPEGSPERRRSMTVAAREERILTMVFGATLSHSMFLWTDRQRTAVEAEQDTETRFVSRVASHLITRVSEHQLRMLMLAVLSALVVADRFLTRRIVRSRPPSSPE